MPGDRSESVRSRISGSMVTVDAQNQPGPQPTSRTRLADLSGNCLAIQGNQPVSAIVYSLLRRARAASLRLSAYCLALSEMMDDMSPPCADPLRPGALRSR